MKENLTVRFTNKDPFKPFSFNTHRGNMVRLQPSESLVLNFGQQKEPLRALKFYDKFKRFLIVTRLGVETNVQNVEQDETPTLEPQNIEENEELEEEKVSNEDELEEVEEEQDDTSETSGYTREELEAMKYQKLLKIAKQNKIETKKKDEIIDALVGE